MSDQFVSAFLTSVRDRFGWLAELGFSEVSAECERLWCDVAYEGPRAFLRARVDRRDDWFSCDLGPLQDGKIPVLQVSLPRSPKHVTEMGAIPLLRGYGVEPRDGFGVYQPEDLRSLDAAIAEVSAAMREHCVPILIGEFGDFRHAAEVLIARRGAGSQGISTDTA